VVSLLSSGDPVSHSRFPFEYFGVLALGILGVMAATSHDFWLSILGPEVWKALHMLVYPAFGLLVLHVALGALQLNAGPGGAILVSSGAAVVLGLHLLAGVKEWRRDRAAPSSGEWLPICQPAKIELNRARGIMVGGERVAVYHHAGGYSAVSGVCRHQAGPLAEGRIIDGCIVCPWHGYQYDPANGTSPPPYQDRLATYRLRIQAGVLEVATEALPPGTRVEPVTI
jgi:nitrite reductase/ring-hydroxylating ferredoxin subunit